MSLSSMPTGTISGGGSGSRTYPPNEPEPGHRSSETDARRRSTDAHASRQSADARGRAAESLQRENQALRRANVHLREKLDAVNRDQQDIIDHYERLLTEVNRDGAVGTSPRGHTARTGTSDTRSKRKQVSAVVRPVVGRLAARVLRTVGLR
ncbi:hypothetical protein [Haloferax sp. YSSS75]|uniref:hypothetical protein n=1 Tax=Haloferax sp. YSSS75 TaxID=3388564 RepID=UPI00398C88E6